MGPTQRVGVEPLRERLYITSHPPRLIGRAQLRRRRRRGCRAPVDDLGRCEVQTHDRHHRFLCVSTLRPYGAHRLYDHRREKRPAPREIRHVRAGGAAGAANLLDSVRADVATLMRAVTPLGDIQAAAKAGYATEPGMCAADSTMGAMGYHFLNRPLFDATLNIERPEMLVFEPMADGKARLVAVEYVVPYRFAPREGPAPRLFGQDLKRYDKFNYWEIHVWAWKQNRSGIFADWNPDVTCPKTRPRKT